MRIPQPGLNILWQSRWLPLAMLPLLALLTKPVFPAWAFMWTIAFAIFLGCKWLTLALAANRTERACPLKAGAYLLAWPGMNAARFLSSRPIEPPAREKIFREAALASGLVLLGGILLFVVARNAREPLLAGWIGMIGIVLLLHFGLFHLLSIAWRALSIDAPPIMNAPLRSTSLGEFWARRWNGAFNDLTLRLVFRPIARHTGTGAATLIAFFISGVVHEVVISVPANGGYGLPSAYFVLQGVGLLVEHSSLGKFLGIGGGIRGWFFTIIVVAAPAFWLFHPPFVRRVILPFMQTIGAL